LADKNIKIILVEGYDDKHALIHLMGHHINNWDNQNPPFACEITNGYEDGPRKTGYITGKLKEEGVTTVGVIFDANKDFIGRWNRMKALLRDSFPEMPDGMPTDGLVMENSEHKRLGIWIMPDNKSSGMLETFLHWLVKDQDQPLLKHANEATEKACVLGAPCKNEPQEKALIHTWLAWQAPPGISFGRALQRSVLDPESGRARDFANWIKRLCQL
jgi:hypothetical protein